VWAALDEWTQQWFDRQLSWEDLVASWCGVWAALLVMGPRLAAGGGWGRLAGWARGAMLVVGPTLALFVALPEGNVQMFRAMRALGLPTRGADVYFHVAGGALGVWWLGVMMLAGAARPRVSAGIALTLALAVAPVLEVVQHAWGRAYFVDTRDVAYHMLGTAGGIAAWVVLRMVRVSLGGGGAVERAGGAE
ncbi:MAG: hypothetical protein AAF823_05480, partial [Planctomycetota bacterium]